MGAMLHGLEEEEEEEGNDLGLLWLGFRVRLGREEMGVWQDWWVRTVREET